MPRSSNVLPVVNMSAMLTRDKLQLMQQQQIHDVSFQNFLSPGIAWYNQVAVDFMKENLMEMHGTKNRMEDLTWSESGGPCPGVADEAPGRLLFYDEGSWG